MAALWPALRSNCSKRMAGPKAMLSTVRSTEPSSTKMIS
jgi:hypothetical protein